MIYSWQCMNLQATQVSRARFGSSCRRSTLHKLICHMCTWVVFSFATTCPLLLMRHMQALSDRVLKECARGSAWYTFYKPHLNCGSLHALDPTRAEWKKGLSYRIYNERYLHPSLKPLPLFILIRILISDLDFLDYYTPYSTTLTVFGNKKLNKSF